MIDTKDFRKMLADPGRVVDVETAGLLCDDIDALRTELERARTAAAETATFATPFVEVHLALLALSNLYWHPPSGKHAHSPSIFHDKPEYIDAIWREASAALGTATTPGSGLGADIFHKAYGIYMRKKSDEAAKESNDGD